MTENLNTTPVAQQSMDSLNVEPTITYEQPQTNIDNPVITPLPPEQANASLNIETL